MDYLTPNEAALVAGITVRDVNRLIDEHILPERFYVFDNGRKLDAAASPFVRFYFEAASVFTSEKRSSLIRRFSDRYDVDEFWRTLLSARGRHMHPKWIIRDEFVEVDLTGFADAAGENYAKLEAARAGVSSDPDILSGTAVFTGTRIPVYDVAASVAAGIDRSRLKSAYPGLTDEMIELAVIYAAAVPARGRPKSAMLTDAKPISERTAERRRA